MSRVLVYLLVQVLLPTVLAYAEKQLTQKQAEELLLNIPDAIAAKAKREFATLNWPTLII